MFDLLLGFLFDGFITKAVGIIVQRLSLVN